MRRQAQAQAQAQAEQPPMAQAEEAAGTSNPGTCSRLDGKSSTFGTCTRVGVVLAAGVAGRAEAGAARGNEQSEDDFDETFAPVFRLESLRILLAVAVQHGMTAHLLDAHNAFVGSDLDRPNCMETPLGLQEFDPDAKSGMVLELRKSLYGLRQSANLWQRKISQFLKAIGFQTISTDPSVFVNKRGTADSPVRG